jgi:hypothetical protein
VNRRNEVVVGAVVLLAIALLIVGTIWLKGTGFGREETEIRARFGQVGQLLMVFLKGPGSLFMAQLLTKKVSRKTSM